MQPGQLSQLGSTISAQPERNQLILLNASKQSNGSKHTKHTETPGLVDTKTMTLSLATCVESCKNSLMIPYQDSEAFLSHLITTTAICRFPRAQNKNGRTSNFYSATLVFYFSLFSCAWARFSWADHHEFLTHTPFSHFSASKCAPMIFMLHLCGRMQGF